MSPDALSPRWCGPVFVVGFPRSGTTLLQQLANAHPDIALAPETHFLGRYWRYRHQRGPLEDDAVWERLLREIAAEPGFENPPGVIARLLERARDAERSWPGALDAVLRAFADVHGASVFGEKTPLHQLHMPRLQRWFPDARFVQIVRDPRAVIRSWEGVPWSSGSTLRDAGEWAYRHRVAETDAGGIHRLLTIRYEDLVTAPGPTVDALCDFLDVEPSPAMLEPERLAVGMSVDREPWKRGAGGPVTAARARAWETELGRGRILVVEAMTRRGMERHGYLPTRGRVGLALLGPPIRAAARASDLWHRHGRPFLLGEDADERPRVVATDPFRDAPNPYGQLLADAVQAADPGIRYDEFRPRSVFARRPPAVWHMQWPASRAAKPNGPRAFFDVAAQVAAVMACRLRRIPLVWTVHNAAPHERRRGWLAGAFMRWLTPRLSGWISLSRAGVGIAVERIPALRRVPHVVVHHGHYAGAYGESPPRDRARRTLGIGGGRVLLALGTIRPYKRLDELARTFAGLRGDDPTLIIAGEPREPEAVRALEAAASGPGIDLRLGQVPAREIPAYFAAADGFVLSADTILNSGSALLALTFGVPVLVPDTPVMAELQQEIGLDAVRIRSSDLTAAELSAFLESAGRVDRNAVAARTRAVHAWGPIGRTVAGLYRSLLDGRGELPG